MTMYPSCAMFNAFQDCPGAILGFSDSDWGGDLVTRRSTSGGLLMHGLHLLCPWSKTQQFVSLSSAEAELHAICKAAGEGLGACSMCQDMGVDMELVLLTDASAARGIALRQGAGKVKHLDVKTLWIQERANRSDLFIEKIPRLQNWSDLLTHHWNEQEGDRHLTGMGVWRRSGPLRGPREGGS